MIKGLCTSLTGSDASLLIEGDKPEVGQYYYLESATEGTGSQNRLFHSLVMEYWKTGQHSYNADNYSDFRNQIKKTLGAGFECFIYADLKKDYKGNYSAVLNEAKTKDEIPKYIIEDPEMKNRIRGKLKSWSEYTKRERKSCIDNLISEMLQVGINTKKFQEIMKGIEK